MLSGLHLGRPWRTLQKNLIGLSACWRAPVSAWVGLISVVSAKSVNLWLPCDMGLVFVLIICGVPVYMLINTTNAKQVHVIPYGTWVLATSLLLRQTFHFCE